MLNIRSRVVKFFKLPKQVVEITGAVADIDRQQRRDAYAHIVAIEDLRGAFMSQAEALRALSKQVDSLALIVMGVQEELAALVSEIQTIQVAGSVVDDSGQLAEITARLASLSSNLTASVADAKAETEPKTVLEPTPTPTETEPTSPVAA